MADYLSTELAGIYSTPVVKPFGAIYGGRPRYYRATITLNTQTTSDDTLLAILPAGSNYFIGWLTSSVSLGTSTIAIGTNKVHGSNGQLLAATTFTAVNTPTPFGIATLLGIATLALTADTPIYLTQGTASLPASGTLVIYLGTLNG